MERYVLDTNLFFNMEPGLGLATKTEEVVVAFTKAAVELRKNDKAEFYMVPKIVDEFLSFFDNKEQQFIKDFLAVVTVKSPDLHNIQFPTAMTAEIIEDVRQRNYRGQTIAEEVMQEAVRVMAGVATSDKKQFEMTIGPVIKRFRDRYRQATRFGFIDSVADFELIVLSKELDAYLVTTDEGVIKWARTFGVKEMLAPVFGKKLQSVVLQ